MKILLSCTLLLVSLFTIHLSAYANNTTAVEPEGLDELSLEELMNVPVVSAAKKSVRLAETTAAVHVVTSEDIRRFGFTSIPQALRLVPGVNVSRIDASGWAVSIRGFNGRFANKLLVMIDGRSVYNPQFSGVFWEKLDVVMEDVDRIEVIRGPGATLWGANAVNGVINIITKNSARTEGGLVSISGGDFRQSDYMFRYGSALDDQSWIRGYAKFHNNAPARGINDEELNDEAWLGMAGVRSDFVLEDDEELSLQAAAINGNAKQTDLVFTGLEFPYSEFVEGDTKYLDLMASLHWKKVLSAYSDLSLKISFSRADLDYPALSAITNQFDIDFHHRFSKGKHEIVWGGGYRLYESEFSETFSISYGSPEAQDWICSGFLQDDINLIDGRLGLVLGTKVEYYTRTDTEVQPNARLLWTPHKNHSLWASVAKAVRAPSGGEQDIRVTVGVQPPGFLGPGLPTARFMYHGNPSVVNETLIAYEAGYRLVPRSWMGIDLAAFYNEYENLTIAETGSGELAFLNGTPYIMIPLDVTNGMNANTWGGELSLDLHPMPWWRVRAAWSLMRHTTELTSDGDNVAMVASPGNSAEHQVHVWSSLDMGKNVSVETSWRYVDPLRGLDVAHYNDLNARISWTVRPGLQVAAAGNNLLQENHLEFQDQQLISSALAVIPRYWSISARLEF